MSNPLDGLKKGYFFDDQMFDTMADVEDHQRKPKVLEALTKLIEDEASVNWVYDNRGEIVDAFKVGGSRHFLKTEKAQLRKSLDAVKVLGEMESTSGIMTQCQKDLSFLLENIEQSYKTFKWPTVKKIEGDELSTAISGALGDITGANDELNVWIAENIEKLKEALDTAKIKREVSAKATDGLNAYRLKKAQEKLGKGGELTPFEQGLVDDAKSA